MGAAGRVKATWRETAEKAIQRQLRAAETDGDEDRARELRRQLLDLALVDFHVDRRGLRRRAADAVHKYEAAVAAAEGNYGKGTA